MTHPETEDREQALSLLNVSHETTLLLNRFADELIRWQRIKNLVGPDTLSSLWLRHIADSVQLLPLMPEAKIWLDLGAGAGLPGVILAILLRNVPGAEVHLVESNSRKCSFLRHVIRETSVPAVVHEGRVEAIIPRLNIKVDVVTARAFTALDSLFSFAEPLLKNNVQGLFPKGREVMTEIDKALKKWDFDYTLSPSITDSEARIIHVTRLSSRSLARE